VSPLNRWIGALAVHGRQRFAGRFALIVALLVCGDRASFAEPAPTPEEVQQAQARWREGKAFFDAGNFEAARVAFRQAYTIFPHPAFLQNLGEAELRSLRYVEAARHLAQYLHLSTSGSPAQRDGAKSSLKKASEKLGVIAIETNVDDAEIRVDDELVGRSPLGSLGWYVEPGRHQVIARKAGYIDGSEAVEVIVGSAKNVYVRLARLVDSGAVVAAAPTDGRGSAEGGRMGARAAPAAAVRQPTSSDARTVVLLAGTTLTAAALTVGAIYAVRTGADSSHLASARTQLADPMGECHDPLPSVKDLCASIVSTNTQLQNDRVARNVSLAVAGALGVVTLSTFLLWPRVGNTAVVPVLGERFAGIVVKGAL
jgi:hypothetical protein